MTKPSVFSDADFDTAVERSRTDRSILIVDFMAAWCGPCRTMDEMTWVDPDVVARLGGANGAFAIQIDVDAEGALAAQLAITSMPTLVAFVAGAEHDRIVGGRRPADLLAWIDLVARNERFEDVQRALRREQYDRTRRALELLESGQYETALPEALWLWQNVPDARDAEFVEQLVQLVAAHPPARAAFDEIREAPPLADAPVGAIYEWTLLNRIVGDGDATLRWYDDVGLDLPPSAATARLVEVAVLPLLVEHGRWARVGRALADPVETFRRMVDAADRGVRPAETRRQASNLVRALYAARREERAYDLEFEITSIDNSKEMLDLVETAKQLGRNDRS